MSKTYEINMSEGSLPKKIILFAVPLMLSSLLQLLFNAVDTVVVGRYCGSDALAAVGSNGSLINLLMNIFIGLSVGTNVLVSRFYGAGKDKDVSETVHTSILSSLIGGVILTFVGLFFARPLLEMMSSPEDVIDLATLYLRIYFLGMPVTLLYNFGSAVLRAVGDTRRPLVFLCISGVVNVVLNLIFVTQFNMGVAGVAVATIISQAISAFLVTKCLLEATGAYRLELSQLKIYPDKFVAMIRNGLPAGIQGMLFSLSNVIIQSSINSFGSVAMAGNAAAANLEGFVYMAMNAFQHTALSFVSQNYGAGKFKRINQSLYWCQFMVIVVGLLLGNGFYLGGNVLLGIYSSDAEVIRYGVMRMSFICSSYFLCGMMDTMVGALRGLGYSVMPMIVSLLGACAFRIVWIKTIFVSQRTLGALYISYPISWALTVSVHIICFIVIRVKMNQKKVENE